MFPDDPANSSAAADGTFSLGNIGIVQGDTVPPHQNTEPENRTTCLQTNGGYISVPFDAALIPTKAEGFTLEAWVGVGTATVHGGIQGGDDDVRTLPAASRASRC